MIKGLLTSPYAYVTWIYWAIFIIYWRLMEERGE